MLAILDDGKIFVEYIHFDSYWKTKFYKWLFCEMFCKYRYIFKSCMYMDGDICITLQVLQKQHTFYLTSKNT